MFITKNKSRTDISAMILASLKPIHSLPTHRGKLLWLTLSMPLLWLHNMPVLGISSWCSYNGKATDQLSRSIPSIHTSKRWPRVRRKTPFCSEVINECRCDREVHKYVKWEGHVQVDLVGFIVSRAAFELGKTMVRNIHRTTSELLTPPMCRRCNCVRKQSWWSARKWEIMIQGHSHKGGCSLSPND